MNALNRNKKKKEGVTPIAKYTINKTKQQQQQKRKKPIAHIRERYEAKILPRGQTIYKTPNTAQ